MKGVKIIWEDDEGNEFVEEHHVGETKLAGHTLLSRWTIKKIKEIK